MKKLIMATGLFIGALFAVLCITVAVWFLRSNGSEISALLNPEIWEAVNDGEHNSNTDLIFFNGYFYLVHASSPYHMGTSRSKLVIRRSTDARTWSTVKVIQVEDTDLRDPKFAVIRGRLFLYILKNLGFEPEPYVTAVSVSADGENWSPISEIAHPGWLFWRPKTRDGRTWYVTAYWHEHGRSILLKSRDGLEWEMVSEIYRGDRNDETAFEFLPDGRMIVTARLEGTRSWHQGAHDACTLIAVASPPFTEWSHTKSMLTRLDGPVLFSHNGKVYALARYDPEGYDRWYGTSSLLGRKRTSLYEITPEGMRRLSDFPSAGDTSYPGAVIRDGSLYFSYYTNNTNGDYPWLLGLIMPSHIMMGRIDLSNLANM